MPENEDQKPEEVAADAPKQYPKWIGAGHEGKVVNSKEEEDALLAAPKEEPKVEAPKVEVPAPAAPTPAAAPPVRP